jgi:hypothetical protein
VVIAPGEVIVALLFKLIDFAVLLPDEVKLALLLEKSPVALIVATVTPAVAPTIILLFGEMDKIFC